MRARTVTHPGTPLPQEVSDGDGAPSARWSVPQFTALDPVPAQLIPGAKLPPRTISVGDPSPWGSAACAAPTWDLRAAAVAQYAVRMAGRPDFLAAALGLAGHDLGCQCPPAAPCHRDVLLDTAQPPADPYAQGGHAIAVTLLRPWASLVLVPQELSAHPIVCIRTWATDYRGAVCVFAGQRVDPGGVTASDRLALDTSWHLGRTGWLGAAVLVDVHRVTRDCCPAPQSTHPRDRPLYHWAFRRGARLARPVRGHGFLGLRAVSWTVLLRATANSGCWHKYPARSSPPPTLDPAGWTRNRWD
jgi:hypothetical protein